MPGTFALRGALVAGFVAVPALAEAQGDRVQVGFTTFHVAGLTTPRAAADSSDAPFFLVSVVGGGARRDTMVPGAGHWVVRLDGVIPPGGLTELTLGDADSAYVEVAVLEHGDTAAYRRLTTAPAANGDGVAPSKDDPAGRRIAPMTRAGAHHVGSVRLLLRRTGGVTYWQRLECTVTCRILGAPTDAPLTQPAAGVVELTGAGGVYHLQLRASRAD